MKHTPEQIREYFEKLDLHDGHCADENEALRAIAGYVYKECPEEEVTADDIQQKVIEEIRRIERERDDKHDRFIYHLKGLGRYCPACQSFLLGRDPMLGPTCGTCHTRVELRTLPQP